MKKILAILCAVTVASGIFWNAAPVFASETDAGSAGNSSVSEQNAAEDEAEAEDEAVSAEDGSSGQTSYEMGCPAEEVEETDLSVPDPDITFPEMIQEARDALKAILKDHQVMAVVYLSDEYVVRATPSTDGEAVITVPSGQTVFIQDVTLDEQYQAWEYVCFYNDETLYSGFVQRANLACSDEDFLDWETEYGMNTEANKPMTIAASTGYTDDVKQFPASYQAALAALKTKHPKWQFVMQKVNLSWDTVVFEELSGDRNVCSGSFDPWMYNNRYGQSNYYVSKATMEYYLDPRSWLDESHVFMFEQLTYNASYQTEAAVQSFLNPTFMKGNLPDNSMSYAKAFVSAGKAYGVSPFHLASRVYQEQGHVTPLISGTYPGYVGYYNYFNIGATGKENDEIIKNGFKKAVEKKWNTPYKSILGGAELLSANYISKGQDTLYLEKFDVDSSYNGLYWHQYMQNISAPHVEGRSMYEMYQKLGGVDNTFVFKIPVYNNMPSSACKMPTVNYSVLVSKPSGYSDTTVYIDGVGYKSVEQGGKLLVTAPGSGSKTVTMYKYDSSGVPTGMSVWTLSYSSKKYTTTAISGLKDLLTYQGFSIRITGNTGIRCMTSISKSVRSNLTGSGVSGYKLKEYGTLVMTKANTSKYPLVKGGTAVGSGIAYGTSGGKHVDAILKTANGRYWYTSVLTNLPVEQYKTPFTFRGYIILTKSGKDYTVYGPTMSGSMYGLATYIVNSGSYKKGSSEDNFLRNIISKAK